MTEEDNIESNEDLDNICEECKKEDDSEIGRAHV